MTLPLASWLMCPWRHTKGEGYGAVVEAAQKLDAQVWGRHGIKLLFVDCPWRFRDMSTAEVERGRVYFEVDDRDPPQLGTHADPTCRHLTADNFYALIGTKTDRLLPLYTMNTAALYTNVNCGERTLRGLFWTRRLWSEHPDRDCDFLVMPQNEGAPKLDTHLPAVFLGTAWTRQDRRGQGIMRDVSRLHRMVAWLRYGPIPQFATVVPDSGAAKVFGGTDIGQVIETRPTHTTTSRVLFYAPDDILNDAEGIAT